MDRGLGLLHVLTLHQDYFLPLCTWKNMCFPKASPAVNIWWCMDDESCSLVYSPGKLLALFFVQTSPDCNEFVIQNGLNIHDVTLTSSLRTQFTLVSVDPEQVSPQVVQQLHMICMKLYTSSDNDAKDAISRS